MVLNYVFYELLLCRTAAIYPTFDFFSQLEVNAPIKAEQCVCLIHVSSFPLLLYQSCSGKRRSIYFAHHIRNGLLYFLLFNICTSGVTTHSFEIICGGWKVGLADHMMHGFYK